MRRVWCVKAARQDYIILVIKQWTTTVQMSETEMTKWYENISSL